MVIVGMQSAVARASGEGTAGTAATRPGGGTAHLIDRVTQVEQSWAELGKQP